MTSSKSPPPQMPFGYAFQDAPDPAPGPALLDDSESNFLDTFFDKMGSTSFENDEFFQGNDAQLPFGYLPEVYHGSSTSFQPSNLNLGPTALLHNGGPQLGSGSLQEYQPAATSADVLAAASTLFNNGFGGEYHGGQEGFNFSPSNGFHDNHSSGPSSGRQSMAPYGQAPPSSMNPSQSDPFHASNYHQSISNTFPNPGLVPSHPVHNLPSKYPARPLEVEWGSDTHFLNNGFVAPANQETEEEVTQEMLHQLQVFQPQSSANTTGPSSPTLVKGRPHQEAFATTAETDTDNGDTEEEQQLSRPAKRRKSTVKKESGDSGEDQMLGSTRKGKLGSKGRKGSIRKGSTSESRGRRRSSQEAGSKPRENLTEEQKRSNHILSEQKRRNLIKQGFDDLSEMIPELRSGGLSKSAMLVHAGDFLENLLEGNKVLRARLAALGGDKGG